ncbi:MAG: hypothetical protein HRU26_09370, partial [Psychroserpens sp.]|nr:hypothetical protein [Psychroserpens sp.]
MAYGKPKFNFYDFIIDVEKKFIANGLIQTPSQIEYFNLFNEIIQSKGPKFIKAFSDQNKLIESYGFTKFSTETIYNQCPFQSSKDRKTKYERAIYNQGEILNRLIVGDNTEEVATELILDSKNENFERISYRAPVILFIMKCLDQKFTEEI